MKDLVYFITIAGLLSVIVFNIWGMVYMTKISFSDPDENNRYCITLSKFQRNLTRLAVVMFWISVFFNWSAIYATALSSMEKIQYKL